MYKLNRHKMSSQTIKLLPGKYYHIYNRGINSCNVFTDSGDYERFLFLYEKYIYPIANSYAWVLMPNHVHFLVKIKENLVYKYTIEEIKLFEKEDVDWELKKWETITCNNDIDGSKLKVPNPSNHLAHLFSSYSKYFNAKYERHGALFEYKFKRNPINNVFYLKQVLLYIHNNPVHHGFCEDAIEYPWSSYLTCLSDKETKILRVDVLKWFDNKGYFKAEHYRSPMDRSIEYWLGI